VASSAFSERSSRGASLGSPAAPWRLRCLCPSGRPAARGAAWFRRSRQPWLHASTGLKNLNPASLKSLHCTEFTCTPLSITPASVASLGPVARMKLLRSASPAFGHPREADGRDERDRRVLLDSHPSLSPCSGFNREAPDAPWPEAMAALGKGLIEDFE
jgi:hypothetical protein